MRYSFKQFVGIINVYNFNSERDNWLGNVLSYMVEDKYRICRLDGYWMFQIHDDTIYYSVLYVEKVMEKEFHMVRESIHEYLKHRLLISGFKFKTLERRERPYRY